MQTKFRFKIKIFEDIYIIESSGFWLKSAILVKVYVHMMN